MISVLNLAHCGKGDLSNPGMAADVPLPLSNPDQRATTPPETESMNVAGRQESKFETLSLV